MTILTSSFSSSYGWGTPTSDAIAYIAVTGGSGSDSTLFVSTYAWYGSNDFRLVGSYNPTWRGTGIAFFNGVSFHPSGDAIVATAQRNATQAVDNVLMAWEWNKTSGWGNQYAAPNIPVSVSASIMNNRDFSPDGEFYNCTYSTTNNVLPIKFDTTNGFGNVYDLVVSVGSGYTADVAWNPTSNVITQFTSFNFGTRVWDSNTQTFGALTAKPGTSYTNPQRLTFSANGNFIIMGGLNVAGNGVRVFTYDVANNVIGADPVSAFQASIYRVITVPDENVLNIVGSSAVSTIEFDQSTGTLGNLIGNFVSINGDRLVSFSTDKKYAFLVGAGDVNRIRVHSFDAATGIGNLIGISSQLPRGPAALASWQPT